MKDLPNPPSLLALDVDGTLLDGSGQLDPARARALQAVSAAVPTIVATGKTWPSVVGLVERFGLAGPHVICNGAATVTANGTIEVLGALPSGVARTVIEELRHRAVAFAVYRADGSIVADAPHAHFARITDLGEAEPSYGQDPPGDIDVLKVLAVLTAEQESNLRELCADGARIQRTGLHFLEWNNPAVSKGTALMHLSATHDWPLAQMIAVGDSENDVSMLLAAGTGVAVQSASATAVAAADLHLSTDVAEFLLGLA